jgi:spore germination protein GerM
MKKLLLWIVIIIALFLAGCKKSISIEQDKALSGEEISITQIDLISDYYPFKENIVMDYEGIGNEYAERKSFVEFVENNRAQMKIMNPGTVVVKVIEYKNGVLTEIFSEGEFYHIENMINSNSNKSSIILKEPLEVGQSWTTEEGYSREITGKEEKIETPSGIYEALEVTTEFANGAIQKDYYAKDLGHVATIYKDDINEVKTLLQKVDKQPQQMKIETYYPTFNDIGTVFVNQNIEFNTNDNIEETLESLLKNPPSDELIAPVSKDTRINKIVLNRNSWTLEVDFSEEFLRDMNAGSTFELEILKSIVNTLGRFYDVEKVYLTVEDVPYESGHFSINPGEYFKVDTTNVEEFSE